MVKIKYVGNVKNGRLNVGSLVYSDLNPGDIIDVDEKYVENMLKNPQFELEKSVSKKQEDKQVEDDELKFDLDGDGDFDKDDVSLAAKVLSKSRKKNK